MKVLSVSLENYGAFYGSHTLDLANKGLTLVLGDNTDEPRMSSNGAAKSSGFEGLDWVLFGEIPKGDHVDSIINDECASVKGVVRLLDEDRGTPIVVERSKVRSKAAQLQFWVGDTHYRALDTAETQKLLERELGLDRDVFHATVLFAQTDTLHFADATEAKRMEILTKILPELSQIDRWLETAKAKAKVLADESENIARRKAEVEGRQAGIVSTLAGLDAKVSNWATQQARDLATITVSGKDLAAQVEREKARLTGEEAVKLEVQRLEAATPAVDFSAANEFEPKIQSVGALIREWSSKVQEAQSKVIAIDRQLVKCRDAVAKGVCPQCGQPMAGAHIAQEMEQLAQERGPVAQEALGAQKAVATYQAELQGLQAQQVSIRANAEQAYKAHMNLVLTARKQLEPYQAIKTSLAGVEYALQAARSEYLRKSTEANPYVGQKEDLEAQVTQLGVLISQISTDIIQNTDQRRYVDFWVDAFGLKGLKNYVLDERLQEMSDAANTWVKMLTGGTIWVRFETQRMGRSTKKLSNDINIRVFRYNPNGTVTERNYKSWSGGEKKRVSWAIDFGLSRLVAARATKRYDLLVLDEVFKHVDSAGGEAVVEMLQHLRQEKSSIFVIEHSDSFTSGFENRLLVRKQGGRSQILMNVETANEKIEGQANQNTSEQSTEAKPKRKKKGRSVPASAPT